MSDDDEWSCAHCGQFIVMMGGGVGMVDIPTLKPLCKKAPSGVHTLKTRVLDGGGGGSALMKAALSSFAEGLLTKRRTAHKTSVNLPPRRSRSQSMDGPASTSLDNLGEPLRSGNGREFRMALTGQQVRDQRELLGWKRPALAELTGLTLAQIAGIETGRKMKEGEEEKLRVALSIGTEEQPPVTEPEPVPADVDAADVVVSPSSEVFTGEDPALPTQDTESDAG